MCWESTKEMNSISMILCLFFTSLAILSAPVNTEGATTTPIDDNELGMGTLYDMVGIFLGDVIQKNRIYSFYNLSLVFEGGHFHSEQFQDGEKLVNYFVGFTICAVIGVVFIVVMPIAGFIFCCCRLCNRCGAVPGKNSHKRVTCKRRTYCTVLTILTTIALAGVVCAFICNALLYKHLQNDNDEGVLGHVKGSFQQIETFINDTVNTYTNYVNEQYQTASTEIISRVNDSVYDGVNKVLQMLRVEELLKEATHIYEEANATNQKLETVSNLLADLSFESTQLKNNLTDIKNKTEAVCKKQNQQSLCSKFNSSQFDTEVDFSSLDRLSTEAGNIAKALKMKDYISKANESLQNVKDNAHHQIKDKITEAEVAVKKVQGSIQSSFSDLTTQKDDLLSDFPNMQSQINDANKEVRNLSKYVYYVAIAVCCGYLLIIVLYYFGLLFGTCGEKPGDGAPCCNTGHGANFLLSGVAFTFIYSWILMIICVVLFCFGGTVYTEVCRNFKGHDPAKLKVFDGVVKNLIKVENYYKQTASDFSFSGVLQNCKEDKALFTALQLDNIINLTQTLDISQFDKTLNDLKNVNFTLDNITITENLGDALENLTKSGLETVDFTKYFAELSKQLTRGNLSQMASIVREIADAHNNSADGDTLRDSATRLQQLNDKTVPEIQNKMAMLNTTLSGLQQKSTLMQDALKLKDNLTNAEVAFNGQKVELIKKQFTTLIEDVFNFTLDRINTIKYEVTEKLQPCQNLSNAFFTLSDAVCIQGIEPVNGMWFSFGWCLFFFVPCLIFAVLLANQYRRTLEDDKEFEEQNYMMYGGPNPDTIPLTSVDRVNGNSAHPHSGMMNAGYRDEAWHGDIPRPQTRT